MRPPGFTETPDERRMRGFEKNQRGIESLHAAKLPVGSWELRKKILFADVDNDGDTRNAFAANQVCKCRNQGRRNVVHAEVPEILERAYRLRFPRPGESSQYDKTGLPCPRAGLRRTHD